MVAGASREFTEWIRERVPGFREQQEPPWPHVSHTTTVMVSDVNARRVKWLLSRSPRTERSPGFGCFFAGARQPVHPL
jgi:hypothetical protein